MPTPRWIALIALGLATAAAGCEYDVRLRNNFGGAVQVTFDGQDLGTLNTGDEVSLGALAPDNYQIQVRSSSWVNTQTVKVYQDCTLKIVSDEIVDDNDCW